jgi:hypothetical protein
VAVVHSNPIPPGVFWVDVFPNKQDQENVFKGWVNASPDVTVLRTERGAEANQRIFTVFEVRGKNVSAFPFAFLGFPTVIKLASQGPVTEADRQTKSDDTVQKPEPTGFGELSSLFGSIDPTLLLVALGLYLYSSKGRRT